jgi:hypothetical protein
MIEKSRKAMHTTECCIGSRPGKMRIEHAARQTTAQ